MNLELSESSSGRLLVIGGKPTLGQKIPPRHLGNSTGKIFRSVIQEARLGNEAAYTSVIMDGSQAVKTEAMKQWRQKLLWQIDALTPSIIILLGAPVLNMWRSDLNITDTDGYSGRLLDHYTVVPFSTIGVSSNLSDERKRTRERLLRYLHLIKTYIDNPTYLIPPMHFCVKCKVQDRWRIELTYDQDQIPYCDKHWDAHKNQWKKERKRWKQPESQKVPMF